MNTHYLIDSKGRGSRLHWWPWVWVSCGSIRILWSHLQTYVLDSILAHELHLIPRSCSLVGPRRSTSTFSHCGQSWVLAGLVRNTLITSCKGLELEKWLSGSKPFLLLESTWGHFPAPIQDCHSNFRGSGGPLFLPWHLQVHCMSTHRDTHNSK